MRAALKCLAVLLALFALVACASVPVPAGLGLKLAPAALGATISVQQHLRLERGPRSDELDAVLEADETHLELVGLALGQRVLTLHYEAGQLQSWRHPMLPSQVQPAAVLEDMQLTLWPAAAIQEALPPGWRIEEQGLQRTLFKGDTAVMRIDYSEPVRWSGTVVLNNLRYHYRLTIQSTPVTN